MGGGGTRAAEKGDGVYRGFTGVREKRNDQRQGAGGRGLPGKKKSSGVKIICRIAKYPRHRGQENGLKSGEGE